VFIGGVQDIDFNKYGKRNVRESYQHETDVPGTTIIIEGKDHGRFWFMSECEAARKEKAQ
jgi:hypothetical protein